MFGWLKRRAQLSVVKSRENDLNRFLRGLQGAGDQEVGFVAALSAHWRNVLEEHLKWDLDHPDLLAAREPTAAWTLNRMIRDVQKQNPAMASGLMTWLHSIRASETPEIRNTARQMWGELERGFPFVITAAHGHYQMFGTSLRIEGYERIPENLMPRAVS